MALLSIHTILTAIILNPYVIAATMIGVAVIVTWLIRVAVRSSENYNSYNHFS